MELLQGAWTSDRMADARDMAANSVGVAVGIAAGVRRARLVGAACRVVAEPTLDLFATARRAARPLADRMRPTTLDEFVGQAHLLAPGKPLRRLLEGGAAAFDDSLGPAGHRQDDAGATRCANVRCGVRRACRP